MIEPPANIGDCRNIFIAAGIQEPDMPLDNSLFPNGRRLAEILNEREALRALANELVASYLIQSGLLDGKCIFCHRWWDQEHEADCLVERAKGLVK